MYLFLLWWILNVYFLSSFSDQFDSNNLADDDGDDVLPGDFLHLHLHTRHRVLREAQDQCGYHSRYAL